MRSTARSIAAACAALVLAAGAAEAKFTETRETTYTANKHNDPHPRTLTHVITAEKRYNDPVTLCIVYFNTFEKSGKGRVRATVDIFREDGSEERLYFNRGVARNHLQQCKQTDRTIKKGDSLVWEYEFEKMPKLRSAGADLVDFFNVLSVVSSSGKLPDFTRRGPAPAAPPADNGGNAGGGNNSGGGNNGGGGSGGGNDGGGNGGGGNGGGGPLTSLTQGDVNGLKTLLKFPAGNRAVALRFEDGFLTIDWRRGSKGFHHIQNYPLAPGAIEKAVQEFVREVSQAGGAGRIGGPTPQDVAQIVRLASWPHQGRGVALRIETRFITNDSRINNKVRTAHGGKHGSLAAAIQAFLRVAPASAGD